jgi:hypothetical protein
MPGAERYPQLSFHHQLIGALILPSLAGLTQLGHPATAVKTFQVRLLICHGHCGVVVDGQEF